MWIQITKETSLLRRQTLPSRRIIIGPSNSTIWYRGLIFIHFSTPDGLYIDSIYIKLDKNFVLLILITLNANEEILLLIQGFTRNETKESQLGFLNSFREYFLDNPNTTEKERGDFKYLIIVSNRVKGLTPAGINVFLKAFYYCIIIHNILRRMLETNLKERLRRYLGLLIQSRLRLNLKPFQIRLSLFPFLHVNI